MKPLRIPAVAAVLALAQLAAAPAVWAEGRGESAPRAAARVAGANEAPDPTAERRLLEILALVRAGQGRQALPAAAALAREYPNFQLAQLVHADLLSARARPIGGVGDAKPSDAPTAALLSELRDEARLRTAASLAKPRPGTVPAQFTSLDPAIRHAIAIDASRSRLYVLQNTAGTMSVVADYYVSIGKLGLDKTSEGDRRTPLGVYFVTQRLSAKGLKDFYGAGALPISYPNPYDQRRGKSGSGIWLHGTPPGQYARAPRATDGCVVLSNDDLRSLMARVQIRTTPVVIADSLQWVSPRALKATSDDFESALSGWREAIASGEVARLARFYAADFRSGDKSLAQWLPDLSARLQDAKAGAIGFRDVSFLHWADTAEIMVVTFGQFNRDRPKDLVKRQQYWVRQGGQWKIFYEGNLA